MWLVNLIPAPYRLWAALGVMALIFASGWHAQTIWNDHKEKKELAKEVVAAREGEVKIIKFNSDFARERKNVKDACIDKSMPDNIRLLLAK